MSTTTTLANTNFISSEALTSYWSEPELKISKFSYGHRIKPLTPVDRSPVVFVNGIPSTHNKVNAAIALLEQSKDTNCRRILKTAGHELADLDNIHQLADRARAWYDPTARTIKAGLIAYLRTSMIKPSRVGPFIRDTDGHVRDPAATVTVHGRKPQDVVRAIAKALPNPAIVGRGAHRMSPDDALAWIEAWEDGDLARCHAIEASYGTPHPFHPGAHPKTMRVQWIAAVAGEVPAGRIWNSTYWPSPVGPLSKNTIETYLVTARCAHPTHLTHSQRRAWVRHHLQGDKRAVDMLSLEAEKRAKTGAGPLTHTPVEHADVLTQRPWTDFVEEPTKLWGFFALYSYLSFHDIEAPANARWKTLVAIVDKHREASAGTDTYDPAQLTFRLAPDQPDLSGYHRKIILLDEHDRPWLFKPEPDEQHRFRPETEHYAHEIARRVGFRTAESALITFDGRYGQVQVMHDVAHNLNGWSGADFTRLNRHQLCDLAAEHVLDWLLDNDDSHGENIVVTAVGHVIGIDKGRAFRYYGGWNGLSADGGADTNCKLVYTQLYDACAAGHIATRDMNIMYRHALAAARRIQRTPDQAIEPLVRAAVAHRPHYKPSWYQPVCDHAPTTTDELVAAVLHRKNTIEADIHTLWSRIYARAGLPAPDLNDGIITHNPDDHPIYTGLHHPALHDAVTMGKSYGVATFFAGTGIEDAHILLWRERDPHGIFRIRGHMKLRCTTLSLVSGWFYRTLNKQRYGYAATPPSPTLPQENAIYGAIISAAKTVSFHSEDGRYNEDKLIALDLAQKNLHLDLKTVGCGKAEHLRERAKLYLGYIDRILKHKADKTKSQEGDFPQYQYVPTEPPAPPKPTFTLTTESSYRDAATLTNRPVLADDGELILSGQRLARIDRNTCGQFGHMYVLTLPTGERIEFRDGNTAAALAQTGELTFTIPDEDTIAESLHRIEAQLADIGLSLQPADAEDLELFYWRHLAGICDSRYDTIEGGTGPKGNPQPQRFKDYRDRLGTAYADRDGELGMWRHAFAAMTSRGDIDAFIAAGGHLPRFGRHDLRSPHRPGGKPYWVRFDMPDPYKHELPSLCYRSGPGAVVATGAAMSTEARMRHLAFWKPGMSSTEDMGYGSSSFVFLRQNLEKSTDGNNVFASPAVLARTSTYAFASDHYGRIESRRGSCPFAEEHFTVYRDSGNEVLVKNTLTLLDDIEILAFKTDQARHRAIRELAAHGITVIRGVPVAVRLIRHRDYKARLTAIAAVRNTYPQAAKR